MSDARPPTPGSANYIQNSTTSTTGNFNITGTGTAGTINAATQYNIGGNRILGSSGAGDLFIGIAAGNGNTTGILNTFVGAEAGNVNSTGNLNAYFGYRASRLMTGNRNAVYGANAGSQFGSGNENSFFGNETASAIGVSSGNQNSYFGHRAGAGTDFADGNTYIGAFTGSLVSIGAYSNNVAVGINAKNQGIALTNSTAIGARALVTSSNSMVLGSINGVNGATADTNVGIGTTAPTQRLHVVGNSLFSGFVSMGDDTTVDGAVIVNGAAPGFFVGNPLVLSSESTFASITSVGRALILNSSGAQNVGIGITTPTDRLDVNGTIRVRTLGAAGATTICRNTSGQISSCSSSLRYKTNVNRFGFGVDLIRQLRPITFDWINGGMKDLGLGAEDVAAIEPLLVNYNEKGEVEGVKYDRIGVVLVNAVNEQQTDIESLKAKLVRQEREIAELKALVCGLMPGASVCSERK
ncbi:MAG: tail fiber domain-containing protein [Acidobacteria bacterium]|nr:tail fiber domain-containing protein [Acidobacteriota bacterium]